MSESFFGAILNNIIPIIFVGIIIYFVFFNFRKKQKIKKLKSGEIPSRAIKGTVSEIKYHTGGNNNSSKIVSWYFVAKGINPTTNEELEFESDAFPYKDSGFKIRLAGPNEEDEKKLLEHARTFIKEGDDVNIHISVEDQDIYYIEDIIKSNDNSFNDISQIPGDIIKFTQGLNIGGGGNNNALYGIKNFRKYFAFIVIIFVFGPLIFLVIGDSSESINFKIPKINLGMNLNFGGSYLVRIIIALLIAFVIYKVVKGYRGSKK